MSGRFEDGGRNTKDGATENDGIMEWWNNGIMGCPDSDFTKDPLFQHSNIPIFRDAVASSITPTLRHAVP